MQCGRVRGLIRRPSPALRVRDRTARAGARGSRGRSSGQPRDRPAWRTVTRSETATWRASDWLSGPAGEPQAPRRPRAQGARLPSARRDEDVDAPACADELRRSGGHEVGDALARAQGCPVGGVSLGQQRRHAGRCRARPRPSCAARQPATDRRTSRRARSAPDMPDREVRRAHDAAGRQVRAGDDHGTAGPSRRCSAASRPATSDAASAPSSSASPARTNARRRRLTTPPGSSMTRRAPRATGRRHAARRRSGGRSRATIASPRPRAPRGRLSAGIGAREARTVVGAPRCAPGRRRRARRAEPSRRRARARWRSGSRSPARVAARRPARSPPAGGSASTSSQPCAQATSRHDAASASSRRRDRRAPGPGRARGRLPARARGR